VAHSPTAAPPPFSTVMSSASILVVRRTSTLSRADAAARGNGNAAFCGGWVSRTTRWSVHAPPRSTLEGTPGSGVSEPNFPPPPANWNAVM